MTSTGHPACVCALTSTGHPACQYNNPMGFKLLYAGFETCFGWDPRHSRCWDPIAKTHLESKFCAILIYISDWLLQATPANVPASVHWLSQAIPAANIHTIGDAAQSAEAIAQASPVAPSILQASTLQACSSRVTPYHTALCILHGEYCMVNIVWRILLQRQG